MNLPSPAQLPLILRHQIRRLSPNTTILQIPPNHPENTLSPRNRDVETILLRHEPCAQKSVQELQHRNEST